MSSPLHTVIGPYRLVRKLGEGGIGEVYEALHETLARQVAIKLLRPQYAHDEDTAKRFFNEARATNLIKHPGLVQITDFGQLADGNAYIVMEYLNGETLGRRLKGLRGRLPLPHVLHISWQVASALAAAHDKGIVHRDLKPDNIMLTPDAVAPIGERAKLLDFGLAKVAADSQGQASLTRSNLIMGTPLYMSPEQCRGAGTVDAKSDVYSLGVLMYQLLAGCPPFLGEGAGELISRHISEEPPPLHEQAPQAPAELVALVNKLLRKDKTLRPSMHQVVAELEQLEALQGSAGTQPADSGTAHPTTLPFADVQIKDLLGGLLEPEIEAERSVQASAASVAVPTQALPAAPTLISGPVSMVGLGESVQRSPTLSGRGRLAVGSLVGGAIALAVVWSLRLLLETGQPEIPHSVPASEGSHVAPLASSGGTDNLTDKGNQLVRWSVDTLPSGASVVRADTGQVLGKTPWSTERPSGGGSLALLLRYPGFAEKTVRLDDTQVSTLRETLHRLPRFLPPLPNARPARAEPTVTPPAQPTEEKPLDAQRKFSFKIFD